MAPVREASRCVSYGSDERQGKKLIEQCGEKPAEENEDTSARGNYLIGFQIKALQREEGFQKNCELKVIN